MKRRALIDTLRAAHGPVALLREEFELLADAVEEADSSHRSFIECECLFVADDDSPVEGAGWWDTLAVMDGTGGHIDSRPVESTLIGKALAYLTRRGLIERKEHFPQMVRFLEDE